MQNCWEDEAERRPTFTEIVSRYHDGLIVGTSKAGVEEGYVLLGSEEKKQYRQHQEGEANGTSSEADSESLLNAIVTHFQKTPPASFVFDVAFLTPNCRRGSLPLAAMPNMEYYVEMNSLPHGASVFVNHTMHDYDNITVEEEEDGHVKTKDHMTDHVTTYRNHVTTDLPQSNSDYILMQSAEPAKSTSQK